MNDINLKYFVGETDKNPLSYQCGEIMRFVITPKFGNKFLDIPQFRFYKWKIEGDDGRIEEGSLSSLDRKPLILTTSLKRPGFVRVIVEACDGEKQPLSDVDRFEGGAAAEIEKIELDSIVPDDYEEFWEKLKMELSEVDFDSARLTKYAAKIDTSGYDVFKFEIDMPFGRPATGLLSIPCDSGDKKLPIRIYCNGYGVTKIDPILEPGTITLAMHAHGLDLDKDDKYFEDLDREPDGKLFYYGFDNVENSRPETTYFHDMIARDLVGAMYLERMPQWDGKTFVVTGGSQGAFQSINIAAHDDKVTFADVCIPWLSNLGGYCYGHDRMRGWSPDYTYGLCYYDTAVAARFIKCPIRIVAGLGDYICPPSGIMALFNGVKTSAELKFLQNKTHSYDCPVEMSYILKK